MGSFYTTFHIFDASGSVILGLAHGNGEAQALACLCKTSPEKGKVETEKGKVEKNRRRSNEKSTEANLAVGSCFLKHRHCLRDSC